MIKSLAKRILVIVLFAVLPGCSTFQLTDLFQGYNSQMKPAKAAMLQGDFVKAISQLKERDQSNNTYI